MSDINDEILTNLYKHLLNTTIGENVGRKIIRTKNGRLFILSETREKSSLGNNLGANNSHDEIAGTLDDGTIYRAGMELQQTHDGALVPRKNTFSCPWCKRPVSKIIKSSYFRFFSYYACSFWHLVFCLIFGDKRGLIK